MVIGERFAWGHLPKTGGEATRTMFEQFPELIEYSAPRHSVEQHATFAEREEEVRGKLLALNIRRLPAWVLSREQHRARWGQHPDYKPLPMDPPEKLAESSFPDYRLSGFLQNGRFPIHRWLRNEMLAEDFVAFMTEITDGQVNVAERIAGVGRVNTNEYNREIADWFTDDQVSRLYENNPVWASIEREVYGEIPVPVGP
jgi:hypothetical protein